LIRSCIKPGCPEPATYRGRCQRHAKQRERTINRAGRQVYATKRWKVARRRVLFEQPLCAIEGCMEIATDVDHIVPLPEGEPYARDNLQGLCRKHHGVKTRSEQGRGGS
jgi:5-methylcytosine-specific restriction endonuclease McrA